ncbi:helix-turn-helix domain-containing protein [Limnohabitans sp.]|jgi:DNA-binding transcriptional regulator YiaG|uniref:helix-turn-helix domain-containing protein n=1 Tax=Limnohabitans sp. TaxID=1907725 RepID=UPI0037BE3D59
MYHYTDGGLRNVWLANGYEIKQTPHGEGVSFHNLDGLTQSICMALTHKACLLTGAELRYIRSAGMLLSQPALGKLMGIDGQSVARWEKTSKVPRWADKLVRLLYTAQAEGNEPIAKAVERIKTVERLVKQKIVVKEFRGHWKPSLQDEGVSAN